MASPRHSCASSEGAASRMHKCTLHHRVITHYCLSHGGAGPCPTHTRHQPDLCTGQAHKAHPQGDPLALQIPPAGNKEYLDRVLYSIEVLYLDRVNRRPGGSLRSKVLKMMATWGACGLVLTESTLPRQRAGDVSMMFPWAARTPQPPTYGFRLIDSYPHDASAFTQVPSSIACISHHCSNP